MKNCEFLRAQKEEKAAQNEYLRTQLHDSMRRRRRALRSASSSRSIRAKEEREESLSEGSLMKKKSLGVQGVEEDNPPLILRLIYRSLKANWIRTISWSGCKQ